MNSLATPTRAPHPHDGAAPADAVRQVRHDIRNHLNTIKLSCAVLQRRPQGEMSRQSIGEIEAAADAINAIITQWKAAQPPAED